MNTVIVRVKLFPARHKKVHSPLVPSTMCRIHCMLRICIFFAAGDDGDCGILTAMGVHNV